MTLDELITAYREEILERCRARVQSRSAPRPSADELERGIPMFLDQLAAALRSHTAQDADTQRVAARHGGNLLAQGFTTAQVVHDFGDICQAVTAVAIARGIPISPEDFRILNLCLDDAMADAVTEYTRIHDRDVAASSVERLGIFAHEARNLLMTANLSLQAVTDGGVGLSGATAQLLRSSLSRLSTLIDRSLADVRLESGQIRHERVLVARLLEEVEVAGALAARRSGAMLSVNLPADLDLVVDGDPQILAAVLINLVQNAIKFSRLHGHVTISVDATADTISIDVADECGGLPPGKPESLFAAFEQRGADRSGLGLGLAIAVRGATAHGGTLNVRDIPTIGCVFTLALPRVPAA